MSNDIKKFAADWGEELERLSKAYQAAEIHALAVRNDESQRAVNLAWEAMLRHMAGEGLEPPEGWHVLER